MTALWHTARMCVFDTETTAPDPEQARLVTACVGEVGGGRDSDIGTWLANPGVDIPAEATEVHGITTEHAREHGADPVEVLCGITDRLQAAWGAGMPVVAYNAVYDFTVLDRECRRHGLDPFRVTGPVVDPFVLDRHLDKYRKGKRILSVTCAHYGVRLDGAHDATEDAIAAARVAWAIARRYPQIAATSLVDLHEQQKTWHRERQADFASYLRRTGKPADDVCTDWPQRPYVEPATGGVFVCQRSGPLAPEDVAAAQAFAGQLRDGGDAR